MHESSKYLNWLLGFVCDHKDKRDFKRLFFHLFNTEFTYILSMDGNREQDGLDLRVRYERETNNSILYPDKPCSVLEMMIALAIRLEEIMYDMDYGDRTSKWFWAMISNLDLLKMTDSNYNEDYVDFIIFRMLNREYEFDGSGSMFYIQGFEGNMQNVDIWYQAMYYLRSITERREINGESYLYS